MAYIGKTASSATQNIFKFVPSSSSTTVTGADAFGRVLSMPSNQDAVSVFLNGILLLGRGVDYSLSTSTVTFTSAYAISDEIIIITLEPFAVADMVKASTGGTFEGGTTHNGGITSTTGTFTGAFTSVGIDDNADAVAMTIDSSEKVGIGTTSPSDTLHVKLSSGQRVARFESNDNTSAHISFKAPNTSLMPTLGVKDEDFYISTGDAVERMRISGSNGKVGIGGTLSTTHLFVQDPSEGTTTQCAVFKSKGASFATESVNIMSERTANTAFSFMKMHSADNSDVEFNFRGDGQGFADGGTFNNPADYAEFFEWKDGNTSDEDRVGYSVILDGNKIVKATSSDDTSKIVGVISGNPVVVGDCAWNRWDGKFVKDDYNRYVREEYSITEWKDSEDKLIQYMTDEIPSDVTVPSDAKVTSTEVDGKTKLTRRKVNSSWDKSKTYIPREDRKEWDMVGMVGKLYLRKGQPTGDRWIKMRDISDTVEEWLVR